MRSVLYLSFEFLEDRTAMSLLQSVNIPEGYWSFSLKQRALIHFIGAGDVERVQKLHKSGASLNTKAVEDMSIERFKWCRTIERFKRCRTIDRSKREKQFSRSRQSSS